MGLVLFAAFVTFYGTGCWYISRHWFGIGRAHPLLPPLIAAMTICIMTAIELHIDGPGVLPLRLWLMINFSAAITTLGICFVEVCDAYVGRDSGRLVVGSAGSAQWPVVIASTMVATAMVAAFIFISSRAAERTLCAGTTALVQCAATSD